MGLLTSAPVATMSNGRCVEECAHVWTNVEQDFGSKIRKKCCRKEYVFARCDRVRRFQDPSQQQNRDLARRRARVDFRGIRRFGFSGQPPPAADHPADSVGDHLGDQPSSSDRIPPYYCPCVKRWTQLPPESTTFVQSHGSSPLSLLSAFCADSVGVV